MALHAGLPVPGIHLCQVLIVALEPISVCINAACRPAEVARYKSRRRAPSLAVGFAQDGRAAGSGGAGGEVVALDADFVGLAELGLPGMSLPSPGGADGGAGLLSGPPHTLGFPSAGSDVVGFPSMSMSSPVRPSTFGGNDSSEIKHIPRNFSLSDLGPDMAMDHTDQLPPGSCNASQPNGLPRADVPVGDSGPAGISRGDGVPEAASGAVHESSGS